jgi:DNA-binding transcriptional LysR family regulator
MATRARNKECATNEKGSQVLDRLDMFITLATERHFGRAAEKCGISQPSLSAALKQLEGELGVQLVVRGSRFEGLTPEGARVLGWAKRIVSDARTLRDEMRSLRHGLSGDLRLGVVPTALPVVTRLTAPFLARHPNVRMQVLSRTSTQILDQIDSLQLDAGVTYLDNEPLGRHVAEPLFSEDYCLLVPTGHSLSGRTDLSWGALSDQPLCLLTPDMQNRRIIDQALAQAGVQVAPRLESNSLILLAAHVRAGPWVSVVTHDVAAIFEMDGALCAVPLSGGPKPRKVGLVAPLRDPYTPVLAALLTEARRLGLRD